MIVAIVLGVLQAITEFLPISSSGHLLVAPWLFGFPNPGLAFDAALHIGTSIALIGYFWKDFTQLIKDRSPLLKLILIASVPGGVIGFLGEKVIDGTFHESNSAIPIVAVGMILATLIIWYIDVHAGQKKPLEKLTQKDAIYIGLGQALALIPGVSRSGSTIAAGLAVGLKREAAARFSFLIGTPIALGAGLYKLLGLLTDSSTDINLLEVGVGILVSAALGAVVIKWLLRYLLTHSLRVFLTYRLVFASLVLIIYYVRTV